MTAVIHIIGARMGDDIFTTDPSVFGREITWNVTRLRQSAEDGWFGAPEILPMGILPPMSDVAQQNIDWRRVDWMLANCVEDGQPRGVLLEPSINVAVRIGGVLHRIPVDGNHRICARRLLGLQQWASYVVPPEAEGSFRVLEVRR